VSLLKTILGIDEAGRGPVIGPLVMCGYLVKEGKIGELRELGVKDSKQLTPEKRESLVPRLKKMAEDFVVLSISPQEIDKLRTETNLNKIEIEHMQQMIDLLCPGKAVIDAPEANTKRFREKVLCRLKHTRFELVAENFADKKYPEVGAASIIAKVHRDAEISKLHHKYGFFGSGYTSDERTIAFLKNWLQDNKDFPDIVRKSWITATLMKKEKEQSNVMSFISRTE